ncbi:MAG: syr [Burkholderiales bacterium]|jgi:arginyl-tRNA synthetase|nr:syr [Burkholderiales bacterium]
MQTITQQLTEKISLAFINAGISNENPIGLVEATRPEFGDFQVNGIMAAAKAQKTSPRDLAAKVIRCLDLSDIAEKIEIAGPGFINITLKNKFLCDFLANLTPENKFGAKVGNSQTIVVDLSSPNLAKEMHVGHLRSTVIGDSLARIFAYMGNNVIRQNHVGDWGTQFGMLIAYMLEKNTDAGIKQLDQNFAIMDLEQFYVQAKIKFDSSLEFANKAREYVVKLQSGDKTTLQYWQLFTKESQRHCDLIYDKLGVNLHSSKSGGSFIANKQVYHIPSQCGESFYNNKLSKIVDKLEEKKLITLSQGAKCIFFSPGELPGGEETPFIVQKQDGGYLYSSTDLAAIDYRVNQLLADKIIYVVDARQSFHFKQLFLVGKKAGFAKPDTQLIHSAFGTMMNEDGRPFKTRDGGTVKLIDLIEEAIVKAKALVENLHADWDENAKNNLANALAIGALKYADLSKNRMSDYVFSFEKMLAFDGNTAPYLMYAYTRIQSILRKAAKTGLQIGTQINPSELSEHKLALHLARFSEIIFAAEKECYPHYLCQYLYNLSTLFMQFYEQCPILKADNLLQQQSRLKLAQITALILHDGLNLLGIQTVDRM